MQTDPVSKYVYLTYTVYFVYEYDWRFIFYLIYDICFLLINIAINLKMRENETMRACEDQKPVRREFVVFT